MLIGRNGINVSRFGVVEVRKKKKIGIYKQ